MELDTVIHEIAQTVQKEANVSAVFGAPLKLDNHTVIPVAVVVVSLGGGGGGLLSKVAEKTGVEAVAKPLGAGGGGGMNVVTVPVGFLSEKEGEVVYTPIQVHEEHIPGVQTGMLNRVLSRVHA